MFGSLLRLLATTFGLVVGLAGLLVFVAALLLALATPAASSVGLSGPCDALPRPVGFGFSPCARLDLSGVDDLRPASLRGDARQGA
jgi:hypothetical protein